MLDRTPSRELNEELWNFPMDYPIKLIGEASEELFEQVASILLTHFPDFDRESIQVKPSKTGKYHSLTAQLRFEEMEQVHQLYADLAQCELIKTAL